MANFMEKLEKIVNDCIGNLPIGLDLSRSDHDEDAGFERDKAVNKIISLIGEALPTDGDTKLKAGNAPQAYKWFMTGWKCYETETKKRLGL